VFAYSFIKMQKVIIVFLLLNLSSFIQSFLSGSSDKPLADQLCMTQSKFEFYCPSDKQCYDGYTRCNEDKQSDCKDQNAGCLGETNRYYKIQLYTGPLSRQHLKSCWTDLKHHFIFYRGFVFEFGSYSQQTLDVLDPKYKYKSQPNFNAHNEGSSQCTLEQVDQHTKFWRQNHNKYDWLDNNCQHYTKSLLTWLSKDCIGYPEKVSCDEPGRTDLNGSNSTGCSCSCDESSSSSSIRRTMYLLIVRFIELFRQQ
jgi:hypothetical protein